MNEPSFLLLMKCDVSILNLNWKTKVVLENGTSETEYVASSAKLLY